MTGPNSKTSQESIEKAKPKSSIGTARMLMREYVSRAVTNPAQRADILAILRTKDESTTQNFYTHLKGYLSTAVGNNPELYQDISGEDIDKLPIQEVKNAIIQASLEFENQKATIKKRIFSEWDEGSFTPAQKLDLESALNDAGNATLRGLVRSRGDRARFLNKNLSDTTNLATVDFDRLCSDIALSDPTPEQKQIVERWMQGYSLAARDIALLLDGLNDADAYNKKKIIAYFLPRVSLEFLLDHRIISRDDAKDAIRKSIKKLDSSLTDKEVQDIDIDGYMSGKPEFFVDTDDLDISNIEQWWNTPKAKKAIAEVIESDLVMIPAPIHDSLDLREDKDGNLHDDFLRVMDRDFRNARTGQSSITGLEKMREGSVIRFFNPRTQNTQYYRVVETDALNDDGHEGMILQSVAENTKTISSAQHWYNYQEVRTEFLSRVKQGESVTIMDAGEFDTEKTERNIRPGVESVDQDMLTLDLLRSYIDDADPEGKRYGLQVNNTIEYLNQDTVEIGLIQINKIHESSKKIDIEDESGKTETATFEQVLAFFTEHDCHRKGSFKTAGDFTENAGIAEIFAENGLKMHGGDHGHDVVPVAALKTADGKGHILIDKTDDGSVIVSVYAGSEKIEKDQKGDLPKKFLGKKHKYYKPQKMSYLQLAVFVKNAKLTDATATNPLNAADSYTDEAPFHMHNNWLKGFMGITNFGEAWKAFEMSWHALEHTLEKGQKINAAKFMYRMFGKMDGDFGSQITADYVEAVGETIDKIKKKINGFNNGLKKRNKCLHLLQDKASKPEEIAAALMVTVEGSGGLYMDQPFVGYAGSWMWFNALIRAAGYSDPARIKAELADKVNEVNAENPTEEMYIEQFLKKYGELYSNPLLMAMGGYPKFRNNLIEGREKEIKKGERDGDELLGGDDRVTLAKNKMNTLELPQVIGIYKSAMKKAAGGPADVIPWMWALSNATVIAHPNVTNTLVNFAYSDGYTFHAIPFCRNPKDSALYKRVVGHVVKDKLGAKASSEFQRIQDLVGHQLSHHHHRSNEDLEAINGDIMKGLDTFWKDYGNILHPILQGTSDSYILEHASENADYAAYISQLQTTHGFRGSAGLGGINKDYAFGGGYRKNPSFEYAEIRSEDGKVHYVRTIKRELEWIRIHGQSGGSIDNEIDTHLFRSSVLPFLGDGIRSIQEPEQQRLTYIENYKGILEWIREYLGTYTEENRYNAVLNQKYMQSLIRLGYDLSFQTVIKNNQLPDPTIKSHADHAAAEASYQRFIGKNAWSATGEMSDTRSRFFRATSANDHDFLRAA